MDDMSNLDANKKSCGEDPAVIRELAQIMADTGLTSLEIRRGEKSLSLKREPAKPAEIPAAFPGMETVAGVAGVAGAAGPAVSAGTAGSAAPVAEQPEEAPAKGPSQVVDFNGMRELKSPMVGVVYTAPEPGAEPFVHIGSKVKKGQTLCILEAMKLMNEYTAPEDGEIVDICIENQQLVEYGQVLFKIY